VTITTQDDLAEIDADTLMQDALRFRRQAKYLNDVADAAEASATALRRAARVKRIIEKRQKKEASNA